MAPEYWNVKGEPWGCVEYSWNGLLNTLLLEHVVGIQPNIPDGRIVVEPNLPDELTFAEAVVPFGKSWVTFRIERKTQPLRQEVVVKNCPEALTLRVRTPTGAAVSSVKLADESISYSDTNQCVEVNVGKTQNCSLTVTY